MSATETGPHEDPMSADRRTIVIGAVAMVLLVAVGVVSAQLFARGGCARVPQAAEVVAAPDADPGTVVGDVLGVDGAATLAALESALGVAADAATPVGDATGLTVPDGGGLVATGPLTTALDADLGPVAALELGAQDLVAGDGDTLYVVTVPNPTTGQVDAITPAAGDDLALGTCLDTAIVGAPFAFHLAAADGDLLLFRIEDDAEFPELELRDASDGRTWASDLTLGSGSPGVLAERLSAGLGPDTVVAARRTSPTDGAPAFVEVARADGTPRGEVDADDLATAGGLDPDRPIRWEVLDVGEDVAFLSGTPDDGEEAEVVLVAVELDLATPIGAAPLTGDVLDAAVTGDTATVVTSTGEGDVEVLTFDPRSGEVTDLGRPGRSDRAHLAILGPDPVVGGDGFAWRAGGDAVPLDVEVAAVRTVGDHLAVLLRGDGDDAVVVRFTAP